jgi:plastocyanin
MGLRTRFVGAFTVLAVAAIVSGCSSLAPGIANTAQIGATSPTDVIVQDLRFVETPIQIQPGQTVTWRFEDGPVAHNVVADDGSFSSGAPQVSGLFRFTFAAAGRHDYHCSVHPYMTGTVIVSS